MVPQFILPSGYQAREVEFVLSRERKGWRFYGRDKNGYCVLACNRHGEPICKGMTFETQREAKFFAETLNLPAYAVWNGRKRSYDGEGAKFMAYPPK